MEPGHLLGLGGLSPRDNPRQHWQRWRLKTSVSEATFPQLSATPWAAPACKGDRPSLQLGLETGSSQNPRVLRKGVSASVTRMAPLRFKLYFKGWGCVTSVSEAMMKKIWGNYGTVPHCISLHNYCAPREAPTSVNSQTQSLENKKYFGAGAMTTKMLLGKDKRGSVINTNSHQKGTPQGLWPHVLHTSHSHFHTADTSQCTNQFTSGRGCAWTAGETWTPPGEEQDTNELETHSQPLCSSGLH